MKCKYEGTGIYEGRCYGTKEIDPCPGYDKCSQFKPNFITNADHIRSMSDEELAKVIAATARCRTCLAQTVCKEHTAGLLSCEGDILEWLKQPYKENTDE